MKKHVVLVVALIVLFSIFIYFYLRKSSYELEYNIDDLTVTESYNKDKNAYYFSIDYDNKTYELISLDKYTNKRKLIDDIKVTQNEDETCLEFTTTDVNLYNICSDNDSYYVENIDDKSTFTSKDSYKNINIGALDDKTYLLWNYHDFIYLNNDSQKTIKLFSKDIYNLSLIYAFENYLLVPDYEQDYIFDKLYVINTNNAKISNINLRFEVYFNSYFLGNDKNNVYLYDLKENQEFYIDLDKKEIYKASSEILVNGDWENVSNQTFQKEKPTFSEEKNLDVVFEDNKLYMKVPDGKTNVLITNRNVSELVKVNGLNIYYISEDILYKYNPFDGEQALLKYSEWNFNHQNMVFIFD